jgi:hypothetical protein
MDVTGPGLLKSNHCSQLGFYETVSCQSYTTSLRRFTGELGAVSNPFGK